MLTVKHPFHWKAVGTDVAVMLHRGAQIIGEDEALLEREHPHLRKLCRKVADPPGVGPGATPPAPTAPPAITPALSSTVTSVPPAPVAPAAPAPAAPVKE